MVCADSCLRSADRLVAPLYLLPLRFQPMAYYSFENPQTGETWGSFETFLWDRFDCQDAGLIEQDPESETGWVSFDFGMGWNSACRFDADPADFEGFYWQACWPGCLPDGDPMGPFPTEQEAIDNANNN